MLIAKNIKFLYCGWALLLAAAPLGCGPPAAVEEEILLRCGELKVSAHDYREALAIVQASTPGGIEPGSPADAAARLKLLGEMRSELVLRRLAAERGVGVAPAELEAAVAAVKGDYPEGVFEQTLLEAAISFEAWRKRLAARLLLEKLVASELAEAVAVAPEEIAAHYDRHFGGLAAAAATEEEFRRLSAALVADLRQKKLEEAVEAWLAQLNDRYPVEENAAVRDRLIHPAETSP
jgi:hypothetical protein